MLNSSSNGTNNQFITNEVSNDYLNDASADLDNLKIISDESTMSHTMTFKKSDSFFTSNHSFLPNYQKVSEKA
ncbi:hypothetical protein RclHR1_14780001 [Rhizophagus clarus]|uniref:Uncharacterized protein n=1 Tax=Rhizophagus clarus TaxID=94130 RepID=A0A2Z6QSU0_9GLOM|nr:hypothetical protein RclHR1_14780001 [Rhizophagus clarus]GES89254.1 hypothetical protein RCL_e2488_RclHR1_14780001 [Rhizophagus clarus]